MRTRGRVISVALASCLALGVGLPVAQTATAAKPAATRAVSTADDTTTTVPLAPTSLVATPAVTSASISFTAPESDGGSPITNFEYSFNQGKTWVAADPAIVAGPMSLTGLTNGARYDVVLRAVNANGPGATSESVNFLLKALKPPKPPKAVQFSIGDKVITRYVKVKPGEVLKVRNVPSGADVVVADFSDPAFTVGVRETNKARMFTSDPLPPARRYLVTVVNSDGTIAAKKNFATERAENAFTIDVWPKGANQGAGVPLVVTFGVPITNKAEVEKALVVTSDKPIGEAGWFWVDSTKAVYRPRTYWPGDATVTLDANLASIEGADGFWGPKVQSKFSTGDQVIMKVNLNSHVMKYTRNGKLEHTFPISGGMANWETESGVKIMTAHIPDKRLYNPDPKEGWDVTVNWAIRVNDNGEYIHDAPWNYNIGYANTSHGCTNMTVGDMGWLFRNTKFGDVVEYTGTSVKMGTDDYLAGYWNFTWPEWKRGSALWQDS